MSEPPTWLAACRRDFRLASAFLTRLPGFQGTDAPAEALGPALRLAPLAGLLVGVCGALAFWAAADLGLPPLVAALIAVGVTLWATGALHEDGLADVADGFGGSFDRARKLEVMRDSRIGAYGVLALILSVGLRAGALGAVGTAVGAPGAAVVLIAAHVLSRGLLAPAMLLLAPAREDGLAAAAGRPAPADAWLALGLGLLLALLALGLGTGLVAGLAALVAAALTGALAARQIGGYTGDVLGAVQQAAEIAVFLSAAALLAP